MRGISREALLLVYIVLVLPNAASTYSPLQLRWFRRRWFYSVSIL